MSSTGADPDHAERNVRVVVQMLMKMADVETQQLATELGIGRSSLSERLHGKRHFTIRELARLCEIFGVEPGIFFADPRKLVGATRLLLQSAVAA